MSENTMHCKRNSSTGEPRGTKLNVSRSVIGCELAGFGAVIFFLWADEIWDLPHLLFHAPATPFNWTESLAETFVIIILAAFVIGITRHTLRRLKYLEGFLPVCSFCKRIRIQDEWIPIEQYISEHSHAVFTHSFCPECGRKHYGEFLVEEEFTGDTDHTT